MSGFYFVLLIAGIALGAVVGLVARYYIFRASCALVNAEPSAFKSILVVLFALALTLVIGGGMLFVGQILFDPQTKTSLFIVWCGLTLAVIWAVLGLIYIPALPVSFTRGLLLSAYEILLGALANALLLGVVLVVYATVQLATKSGPAQGTPARTALSSGPVAALVAGPTR